VRSEERGFNPALKRALFKFPTPSALNGSPLTNRSARKERSSRIPLFGGVETPPFLRSQTFGEAYRLNSRCDSLNFILWR
jgi:hypothetical protein